MYRNHRSPSESMSPEPQASMSNYYIEGAEGSQRPPRQNKTILQRQYREKEGDSFNSLREIIKQLTSEEPGTRLEILTKASQLLKDLGRQNAQLKQVVASQSGSHPAALPSPPAPVSPTRRAHQHVSPPSMMLGSDTAYLAPPADCSIPPSNWPLLGNCEYQPTQGVPPQNHMPVQFTGMESGMCDPATSMGQYPSDIDILCTTFDQGSFRPYDQPSGSHMNYWGMPNRG